MKSKENLVELSRKLRLRLLDLTYSVGKNGAHIGGALSTVETLVTLFHDFLKFDINDPTNISRDRFILSKGHSAMALFAILEQVGFISKEELDQFEVNGSPFYAHASRKIEKGIEFSGGSLSLGISYAVGVALNCKQQKLDNHIYVMVGDGECDEGLVWEALMSAANFHLTNLTVIVDANGFQSDGNKLEIMNHFSLAAKFDSFGFNVHNLDGHNLDELRVAFSDKSTEKPNAIIANTKKGKGVSFMECNGIWHHGSLNNDQYNLAISEQI